MSANVVTANVGTANVSVCNTSSLNVSGTAFLSNANVLTGNITSANIVSLNVTGDANIAQNLTLKNNLYTSNIIMSSNLSTNSGQGNVYISANLVVNGNIFSIGGSVGSGSGTSQGVTYVLPSSYSLGAAFATGSAGPGIAGFHINMSSFTPQAIASVSSFSASSGMLKFTSAGLYSVQCVLVGDQPAAKVGIGSTSSASFPPSVTATSGYVYVYNYPLNSSPTTLVTIPLNITDVSKWYYLDAYFSTGATLLYQTAPPSGSAAGSNYGTYVQVGPFGNYLTSATGVASGLLCNCSASSNLSGSYSSNAYRVTLTSSNGWTVSGVSTSITAPTANGYFQVNQAGIYEVSMCLNTVPSGGNPPPSPVQFQLGSLSSDTATPGTSTPAYLYTYAPMYTQDPTTTISMPVNITNVSNVYFVEVSFQGSSTANVGLSATSTFLSIKPIGSYVTPSTNPWNVSGSLVYYSNGAVGIGTSGTPTETLTVLGNTSFISNVTVTSDVSGANYVNSLRVPAGSAQVNNYVVGAVPLTTTTNLIQNYLSNAATISVAGVANYGPALYLPLNTTSSYASIPSNSAYFNPNSANVFYEAWIYYSNITATQSVISISNVAGVENGGMYLSGSSIRGFWYNSTRATPVQATAASISATTWTHVALFINSTASPPTITVFKNGTPGGTPVAFTASTPYYSTTDGAQLLMGGNLAGLTTVNSNNAYIYDVRVYSGGIVNTGGFSAPANPTPFGTTQPGYVTGTPSLRMSLQSQYFPGASTSPYGPCLTLPGTVGSYYSAVNTAYDTNWKTNGFCLEAWVNYASFANSNLYYVTSSGPYTMGHFTPIANSYDWGFGALVNGQIALYWDQGSATVRSLNTFSTITTGSWNHIMVQSNGSNVYIAVNGVFQALKAFGTSYTPSGDGTIAPAMTTTLQVTSGIPFTVGQFGQNSSVAGPNFAIAKARLTFGTSGNPALGNVYSSGNFTANPNFASAPNGASVAWQLDSQYPLPTFPSIQDVTELPQQATSYGSLPTPIGGVTSNVLGPYTGTQLDSIRFDGTGYIDYGNAASSVMTTNIWASNWTIEGWVYVTSYAQTQILVSRSVSASFDFLVLLTAANPPSFYLQTQAGYIGGASVPLNTWTHIAATYDGTRANVYTGGSISQSSTTFTPSFTPTYSFQVGTGYGGSSSYSLSGNLADVRVSNVARYTGSSYTVPNAPFASNDANTLLLLKSLAGQQGTTLEVQGRGLNAVSLGATRSVQSYPPAPMSSYLLDTTSNSSVSYGVGKYVASASSEYDTTGTYAAWKVFNKNSSGSTNYSCLTGLYSTSSPYAYTGSVRTVDILGNSYAGEWLQIQLPVSVVLSTYTLLEYASNQALTAFSVLGSRDGINWTLVDYRSGVTAWSGTPASLTFTASTTQAYNCFRLVAQNNNGAAYFNACQWTLNGTEESLCITSDAKVGVGIANPQRALEVAGDLVVSGTISGGAGMGSFRNRIINGDMRIDQRNGGTAVTAGGPSVDRWSMTTFGIGGGFTQGRVAVTDLQGYNYALRITIGASTLSGSGAYRMRTVIEGYNIADLYWGTSQGVPVTVSFWVKTSAPGVYTYFLGNRDTDGSASSTTTQYLTPFTVFNANAWEYKTLTIPPPPNGTAWDTTTNLGISSCFIFYENTSSKQTSASGWYTNSTTDWIISPVNIFQIPNTTWNVTGVQLEKGTVATPFEVRPYATELQLCQRYYQLYNTSGGSGVSNGILGIGHVGSSTVVQFAIPLKVSMRVGPTSFSNTAVGNYVLAQAATGYTITGFLMPYVSSELVWFQTASSGTLPNVGGAAILYAANSSGFLGFSAEL